MKYLFLIALLVSSLFSFEWSAEYEDALEQAKKEHKGVYVLVGTENCPFCEKLKKTTLSDDEVIKALEKEYVLIYLSKDIDDIPQNMTISFYPAHYFLDENGKILHSTAGYRGKKCFLQLIKDVKGDI